MADAVQIQNHLQLALGRTARQLKLQPNWQKLAAALVGSVQDAENTVFGMIVAMRLATATGTTLDSIGDIVGEKRNGQTDTSYRLRIRVRSLANRASGTIPEMLAGMALLGDQVGVEAFGASASVVEEFAPAAFVYHLNTFMVTEPPTDYLYALGLFRPAGVNGQLWYRVQQANVMLVLAMNQPTVEGPNQFYGWTPGNITITGGFPDPFGGNTAQLWTTDLTFNSHLGSCLLSVVSGNWYRLRIYLKHGTSNNLNTMDRGPGGQVAWMDLIDEKIGFWGATGRGPLAAQDGALATNGLSRAVGGGWFLFQFDYNAASTQADNFRFFMWSNNFQAFTGTGETIYVAAPYTGVLSLPTQLGLALNQGVLAGQRSL